ncbi:MAG: TonB family protein [Rickettsiales bacterium]|nr:TonB family protein [Pseudomonadota bacterium]MDA0966159.1 TonB family protein [Pseudomonadota bacterium]MDG4543176.1 TonB family protein [Rickettsiales bacterium]MDG4545374.1 TonB family protein [Rickettsiales bacterium]MDG4547823.1 TonB family protein [Rickettsiales bacterium]
MKKDNEYFSIFFIFSGVIHILLLTVNFAFDDANEPTKFHELKIKLGVDKAALENKNSPLPIASVPKENQDVVEADNANDNDTSDIDLSELKLSDETEDFNAIDVKPKPKPQDSDISKKSQFVAKEQKMVRKVVEVAAEGMIIPDTASDEIYIEPSSSEKHEVGTLGSKVGNVTDEESQDLVTYEQMLPLWLKKFQVYPEQAELLRLSGRGILKITIRRNGKVLKAEIEESTGHPILDSALLSMAERADPVIPVPPDHLPEMNILTYKMAFGFSSKNE